MDQEMKGVQSQQNTVEQAGWRTYGWGLIAALSCPCHLLLLVALLAGTTTGAFIGEHWVVAALAMTGLFFVSLVRISRSFKRKP